MAWAPAGVRGNSKVAPKCSMALKKLKLSDLCTGSFLQEGFHVNGPILGGIFWIGLTTPKRNANRATQTHTKGSGLPNLGALKK